MKEITPEGAASAASSVNAPAAMFQAATYQFPDSRGHFGPYGGTFVSETLSHAISELKEAYARYQHDPAFLEEFQQRFPQAETLKLPEAGHYVFEDAPEAIIPRVREFLAAHPLPGPAASR